MILKQNITITKCSKAGSLQTHTSIDTKYSTYLYLTLKRHPHTRYKLRTINKQYNTCKTNLEQTHSFRQSFIHSPTDAPVSCLKNDIKIYIKTALTSDVWLTVHRNSVWIRKTN